MRGRPTSAVWRVLALVRGAEAARAVFSLLGEIAPAVSAFETGPDEWRLEAYPESTVLAPDRAAQLALAAAAAGGNLVEIGEEKLAARDWLAENQLTFPPLRVGRFFIYGSHHRGGVPAGAIGIRVDAATAFGTGEHASTRACLLALEQLARRHRFRRVLDIGTGTGILAIAAAKLLHRTVLASDIDAGAVLVARLNLARNRVNRLVRLRRASGYRDRAVCKSRSDLILSNILARPLALLASELARALAPGGRAVLSGLLRRQEPIVLVPHRGFGITLERRLVLDGWSTLILRRRHEPKMTMGAQAPIVGSVRRPFERISLAAQLGRPLPTGRQHSHPRKGRGSPSGEFRYRPASGRRAPSAGQRPSAGSATRQSLFRLKSTDSITA